jgi:hypothetical protein
MMLISELIEELESIKAAYGDITCYCYDGDGGYEPMKFGILEEGMCYISESLGVCGEGVYF